MNPSNTTVIICCAGMGTRLGIGTTKAMITILNKPLIVRLIEQLEEYDDLRIVVGFQAEKIINTVNKYRNDILYAFNYDFETTGPAASLWKGLKGARDNIIILDGDLVVEPTSFKDFLKFNNECIAYTFNTTDEPIYLNVNDNIVESFCNNRTDYIWPGIVKIKKNRIKNGLNFIYETISDSLPIKAIKVNAMEIDTQDDYEKTLKWLNNNYEGE